MLIKVARKKMGLFSSIKKVLESPSRALQKEVTPAGMDNPRVPNTALEFEETASEWIAHVTGKVYERHIFQNPEAYGQGNFGTLDNPHLIFTNDIPFRFVGCSGPPNEDDYEGHELMFFLLREGSL